MRGRLPLRDAERYVGSPEGYCATNLAEDQQTITEGIAKIPIFRPQRTLGEQPAAAGEAALGSIQGWGTSESWTFMPEIQPLIEPELIGWLPKGVFVYRVQKEFGFFQAPLLQEAPFSLHAFLGLDAVSDVLVEGVHYSKADRSDVDRMRTWGTDHRLALALGRSEMIDPDSVVRDHQAPAPDSYRNIPTSIATLIPGAASSATDSGDGASGAADSGAILTAEKLDGRQAGGRGPNAGRSQVPATEPTAQEDQFAKASSGNQVASLDPQVVEQLAAVVQPEGIAARREAELTAIADAGPSLHPVEVREEGLIARGAADAAGQRTGHWFLSSTQGLPAGDGFYQNGQRVGAWTFRNATGLVERTAQYAEGLVVCEERVEPPRAELLEALPPGPLPKPVLVDRTDEDGFRYRGMLRDGTVKVGMWEIFRPDNTRAEIHHYHMITGKPERLWERYDERGDLIETYSPV